MLIGLYLLLLLLDLALWVWLTERIWRVSPAAAGASFFLLIPAVYWCWKLWNVPGAGIRIPAMANLVLTVILTLMSYRIGSAELDRFAYGDAIAIEKHPELAPRQANGDMVEWCRRVHHANYDAQLATCVEPAPDDANVIAASSQTLVQLAGYFKQNGLDGEFDTTRSVEDDALLAQPGITAVANYHLFPLSPRQVAVKLLICSSRSACSDFERATPMTLQRNANLLLSVAGISDDNRIRLLQSVFSRYHVG